MSSSAASAGPIKLGVCGAASDYDAIAAAGFDYAEPGAAEIADMTPDAFAGFLEKVQKGPIRCEAFNSFIRRPALRVVGENPDLPALIAYVETTLDRCRQLGANCVIWGSAGSRRVPEGFSREKASDQIAEFLRQAGPIAQRNGIMLSIEPLNRRESNILNSGHEALRIVQQVAHPNVQFIIDYYHLLAERESLDIFDLGRGHISHLHFSCPVRKDGAITSRVWPSQGEEDPDYPAFFAKLKTSAWRGGMSLEGKGTPEVNGPSSLTFLRRALADAGLGPQTGLAPK